MSGWSLEARLPVRTGQHGFPNRVRVGGRKENENPQRKVSGQSGKARISWWTPSLHLAPAWLSPLSPLLLWTQSWGDLTRMRVRGLRNGFPGGGRRSAILSLGQ